MTQQLVSFTHTPFSKIQIMRITQHILASFFILGFWATQLNAQQVGNITTLSSSCKVTISACEGDTLILRPQDQASFTNYKWYRGSIAPTNEITAANAAANNVVAAIFTDSFPTIKVISGGGTYYLTADYASPANCAAINDTFELNFTPRPIANPATLTACELMNGGGTANFTLTNADATVTGGAAGVTVTYHATLANAKADASPLSSPYNSASGTIYARVENNVTGCYQTAAITLTMNPKPVIADGAVTICSGISTNLTTQITSYGTYLNPVWTIGTAGGTAVSTPTAVSPTSNTTYVLVAENGSGCKDTAQVVVTVNPTDAIAATGSNPTTCAATNGSVTITGLANSTSYTVNYTGTAGSPASGATASSNGSGQITITGLGAGSYTNISVSRNACPSNTVATVTLSDPAAPSVTDPADQVLCATANTTAITFSGTAGATFNWTNNTASIGLAASGSGNIATFAATNTGATPVVATITVTPSLAGCTGTAQTFTITVNPKPDFTLVKPTACPGTSEEVNITALTNAVAATSQYKIDAGAFAAYPSPATLTGLSVGSRTVTVRNAEGCETAKSVTINSVPARVCIPVTVTRSPN
jgi:large repetitive protein